MTQEPDNALAAAMRELQAARGVNEELRSAPQAQDLAPMSDEEAAAAFARDTGLVIDPTSGAVIGRVAPALPGAQSVQERRAELAAAIEGEGLPPMAPPTGILGRQPAAPAPTPDQVGLKGPINGIDLDDKVVVLDGEEFEMTEAEIKGVVIFTNQVAARALQKRLNDRLTAAGIEIKEPTDAKAVPKVRGRKGRR